MDDKQNSGMELWFDQFELGRDPLVHLATLENIGLTWKVPVKPAKISASPSLSVTHVA